MKRLQRSKQRIQYEKLKTCKDKGAFYEKEGRGVYKGIA